MTCRDAFYVVLLYKVNYKYTRSCHLIMVTGGSQCVTRLPAKFVIINVNTVVFFKQQREFYFAIVFSLNLNYFECRDIETCLTTATTAD